MQIFDNIQFEKNIYIGFLRCILSFFPKLCSFSKSPEITNAFSLALMFSDQQYPNSTIRFRTEIYQIEIGIFYSTSIHLDKLNTNNWHKLKQVKIKSSTIYETIFSMVSCFGYTKDQKIITYHMPISTKSNRNFVPDNIHQH